MFGEGFLKANLQKNLTKTLKSFKKNYLVGSNCSQGGVWTLFRRLNIYQEDVWTSVSRTFEPPSGVNAPNRMFECLPLFASFFRMFMIFFLWFSIAIELATILPIHTYLKWIQLSSSLKLTTTVDTILFAKKKRRKKKVKRIEGKTARKTIENNHWHLEIKIILLNRKQELCYWKKKKNKNGGWAIFKEKRMRNHKPKAKRVWNLISSETLFVT